MGSRLFSGWGVRTLAEGEGRYNPIGYHVGTIWPFDNSFIAWGLRRYGFKEEAARIAAGILDAAEFFDGRLPEAFGGYRADVTKYPVQYPTACSPQAWSTGAPLLFLRTMLGLEPPGDHLIVDPALPRASAISSCSTFPDAGAASTPSGGAPSTSTRWKGRVGNWGWSATFGRRKDARCPTKGVPMSDGYARQATRDIQALFQCRWRAP